MSQVWWCVPAILALGDWARRTANSRSAWAAWWALVSTDNYICTTDPQIFFLSLFPIQCNTTTMHRAFWFKFTGEYVWITCKYYSILFKESKHSRTLVSAEFLDPGLSGHSCGYTPHSVSTDFPVLSINKMWHFAMLSFIYHSNFKAYPHWRMCENFILFYCWIKCHCVAIAQFYLFICMLKDIWIVSVLDY